MNWWLFLFVNPSCRAAESESLIFILAQLSPCSPAADSKLVANATLKACESNIQLWVSCFCPETWSFGISNQSQLEDFKSVNSIWSSLIPSVAVYRTLLVSFIPTLLQLHEDYLYHTWTSLALAIGQKLASQERFYGETLFQTSVLVSICRDCEERNWQAFGVCQALQYTTHNVRVFNATFSYPFLSPPCFILLRIIGSMDEVMDLVTSLTTEFKEEPLRLRLWHFFHA